MSSLPVPTNSSYSSLPPYALRQLLHGIGGVFSVRHAINWPSEEEKCRGKRSATVRGGFNAMGCVAGEQHAGKPIPVEDEGSFRLNGFSMNFCVFFTWQRPLCLVE